MMVPRNCTIAAIAVVSMGCTQPTDPGPARGRYVITDATDERLVGGTVEVGPGAMVLFYTDEYGATYRISFRE